MDEDRFELLVKGSLMTDDGKAIVEAIDRLTRTMVWLSFVQIADSRSKIFGINRETAAHLGKMLDKELLALDAASKEREA